MALTEKDVEGWKKDKETGWLIEPKSKRLVNPAALDRYDFTDQEEGN